MINIRLYLPFWMPGVIRRKVAHEFAIAALAELYDATAAG